MPETNSEKLVIAAFILAAIFNTRRLEIRSCLRARASYLIVSDANKDYESVF